MSFLSPAATADRPARSPLADAALAAGGQIELRHAWELAASFGDPSVEADRLHRSVGFTDLSLLGKIELTGTPKELEPVAGQLARGMAVSVSDRWFCPVTPTRVLALFEVGSHPSGANLAGARICDLSGALGALAVSGPSARDAFARFCALDLREAELPVGGFRPGSVARTPGYVLRQGPERFLMLFGAAYGEYVWETVAAAAAALGGGPVGLDAFVDARVETPHA